MEIADKYRRLKVRSNADIPRDALKGARVRRRGHRALPHGAHVLREERLPLVVQMIMSAPVVKSLAEKLAAREKALASLLNMPADEDKRRSPRTRRSWPRSSSTLRP